MARRLVSTAVRMRGGATLGFGARVRIYDDEALTTLSTIYRRATGVGTQPNPLLPNAGRQTALTVNGAAVDTTITVASTAGFQVGDLIPLRDGVNAIYRVITAINPGTGVITLDSALGFAFLASATTVGAPEMRGHIWGWLEIVLDPFAEVEDIASGRRSPPLQIQISLPASLVSVMEQSAALGQFSVINFLGTAITAADAGAGQLNVTVSADFTDQAFLTLGANAASFGYIRIPNAGYLSARNFANTANIPLIGTDVSDVVNIATNGQAVLVGGNITGAGFIKASTTLSVGTTPAAAGDVRLPTSPTISNRNAGNTADEQIWPHLTVENALGADVNMVTGGTWYDGPSVSLPPGTWMLTGAVTVAISSGLAGANAQAKLWDGTTAIDSGEFVVYVPSGGSPTVRIALLGKVTLASTTTYKISCVSSGANSTIKAATTNNGSGNHASHLLAVRIGN